MFGLNQSDLLTIQGTLTNHFPSILTPAVYTQHEITKSAKTPFPVPCGLVASWSRDTAVPSSRDLPFPVQQGSQGGLVSCRGRGGWADRVLQAVLVSTAL